MKKLHATLLGLGLAFLAFLIWRTGVRQIWQQLTFLGWGLIPIILAEGVAEFFHTVSWRYCFNGLHRRIPLASLFRIHLAGYAVNFLTPTASMGGEVAKGALLVGDRKEVEAVAGVLVGKLSFGLAHLLFVIFGLSVVLPGLQLSPMLQLLLLLSGAALAAGIGTFLRLQKQGRLGSVIQWLIARGIFAKALQPFIKPMERVDEVLKVFYRERPWDLARSMFWHMLGYSVGIFSIWYFLFLLNKDPGFVAAARIWFLTLWFDLVTFAVPLNLGVLEGGRLVAFRSFGFGTVPGMTFGIVTRLAQVFWAGIGLINYALLITWRRSVSPRIANGERCESVNLRST